MPDFVAQLKQKRAAASASAPAANRSRAFAQQILALGQNQPQENMSAAPAANGQPLHTQPPHVVFNQYAPLINREVSRWEASGLPRVVLEAEAKRLVARALPTFDPKKGANLTTHLSNHLRKLDAFVTTYKPDIRMPLDRAYMRNKAIAAQADLRLELGTEPTQEQIARRLGVAPAQVADLHRAQTNLYSSTEAGGHSQPVMEPVGQREIVMNFLHHDLSPIHKTVFEHTVGYNGAPVLTGQELAAKLRVPPARVQALRTEVAQHMQRYSSAVDSLRS